MDESKLRWRLASDARTESHSYATKSCDDSWGNLLHIGWASLDSDLIQLRGGTTSSMRTNQMAHASAMWTLAIQLMVTGLGWTDLRAGLDRLRIEGIHEHTRDPILKFIARNFGDSIFALDTFLGLHPREQLQNAIQAIAETGRNTAASRSGADLAPIEFEVPDVYEVEAHQANVQRLWLRGGTASTWLTNALFEGGTDPLHLEANNAELIDPYTGGSMMGASRLDESLGHRQIHTCDYAYLAHETQRWFGIVSRQRPNSEIDQTLEYRIDGWPSFGFFKFNYSTGRAYRVGSERSHEWGNPNI